MKKFIAFVTFVFYLAVSTFAFAQKGDFIPIEGDSTETNITIFKGDINLQKGDTTTTNTISPEKGDVSPAPAPIIKGDLFKGDTIVDEPKKPFWNFWKGDISPAPAPIIKGDLFKGDITINKGDTIINKGDVDLFKGDTIVNEPKRSFWNFWKGDISPAPTKGDLNKGDTIINKGDLDLNKGDTIINKGDLDLNKGDTIVDEPKRSFWGYFFGLFKGN